MFLMPLAADFSDSAHLVSFCDVSPTRMQYWVDQIRNIATDTPDIEFYRPEDFSRMLAEHKPDTVIVCSVDSTHAGYIVQSLRAGCDVVVEKPMATTLDQLHEISAAARETGRNVHVAFNYRWAPLYTQIREIIQSGEIGTVMHVSFEYMLNTKHGADYFRRWHARMENSGGLLIHKATHHFDLVNWWIDSIPESVGANGALRFYGKENAIARGDEHLTRYDRYLDPASKNDPFRLDLLSKGKNVHYHEAEKDSGYIRDRNVFRDDIDIYDTMSLTAKYRCGAFLTYSLVAYSPYEGFRVTFTGDRGRLEQTVFKPSHLILGQSEKELSAQQNRQGGKSLNGEIVVQKLFNESRKIPLKTAEGGHWGGDPLLRNWLFSSGESRNEDPFGCAAGWEQGLASVLLGLGANESIATGKIINLNDLYPIDPSIRKLSGLL
jgi:predicted dehydrogenase